MADKRKQAASAAKRYQKSEMACNKPQRAPKGDKHKYVVKACQDGKEGIVRFGEQRIWQTKGRLPSTQGQRKSDRINKNVRSFTIVQI
jgi:hypothetical protein